MIIDCAKAKFRARWLRYGVWTLMVLIAAGNVLAATEGFGSRTPGATFWVAASVSPSLDRFPGLMAVDVALLSLVVVAGLYQLVRLMHRFEQGDFFSVRAIGHLKAFAFLMLIAAFIDCVLPPVILLTAHLTGMQNVRSLAFDIGGTDIWVGLVSAIFLTITTVMGEARKLAEDHELIV